MKSRDEVLQAFRSDGKTSECIDHRDTLRLLKYFSVIEFPLFGFQFKEGTELPKLVEWTKENVLEDLRDDLAFAFSKALGKRGISSTMMYEVVKMWLWVLEDPLQDMEDYAQYGLPLFKAVALKYGFDNPIGNDAGTESQYAG